MHTAHTTQDKHHLHYIAFRESIYPLLFSDNHIPLYTLILNLAKCPTGSKIIIIVIMGPPGSCPPLIWKSVSGTSISKSHGEKKKRFHQKKVKLEGLFSFHGPSRAR